MDKLPRGIQHGCVLLAWALFALGLGCAKGPGLVESDEPRDPVEVEAMVDRAVATTGDLLTYRIRVDSDPTWEVEIPEAGADIASFRIVDVGQEDPVEKGGRVQRERWYQLRADLVGSYVLPPVEVRSRPIPTADGEPGSWQTQVTSEIFIEVESVLPSDTEAADIRQLKPLREVRASPSWVIIVATALGIALLGAALFWYLRRRASKTDLQPPIPAHELAFEALNGLRSTDFSNSASVRRFYFQISEVVRAYVEGRFRLNATDLTTEEIVANFGSVEDLPAAQNQVLHEFLIDTDQVKFAHREPTSEDIEGTYEQALGFVEATRPQPSMAEEEQAA
jgi:hypothetical protein